MIPASKGIAQVVYQQLMTTFPHHRSRRGILKHVEVAHSCLRDLKMFQAYFWLCILEENLAPIQEELLELCVMVLPSLDVKWELIEAWTQALADEIISYVEPFQYKDVLPYTTGMCQAFVNAKPHLNILADRSASI